jgi:hypothetical protein
MSHVLLLAILMHSSGMHEGSLQHHDTLSDKTAPNTSLDPSAPATIKQSSAPNPNLRIAEDADPLVETKESYRLIISGGLGGIRNGEEGFFHSPLFFANSGLPIQIENAEAVVWKTQDGVFFGANGDVGIEDLLLAANAPIEISVQRTGLWGPNTVGIPVFPKDPHSLPQLAQFSDDITRLFAAVRSPVYMERRQINGKHLWGAALNGSQTLRWPSANEAVLSIPAAKVRYVTSEENAQPFMFFARSQSATARAFGIIDALLADDSKPNTIYLDAGDALQSKHDTSLKTATAMLRFINARNPVVLAAGSSEYKVIEEHPALFNDSKHLFPIKKGVSPAAQIPRGLRRVKLGDSELIFVAVDLYGAADEDSSNTYRHEKNLFAATQMLRAELSQSPADIVIGLSTTIDGKEHALSSGLFDLVVHLAGQQQLALPSEDTIDMSDNHANKLHATPGLVRVSSGDVTEVQISIPQQERVERIHIRRYPIVGQGEQAKDVVEYQQKNQQVALHSAGLPDRSFLGGNITHWRGSELSGLRGQWMRSALGAEIAITRATANPALVRGPIPKRLAQSWLTDNTRALALALPGKTLKELLKILGTRSDHNFMVVGATTGDQKVAFRNIDPLENYRVAISLDAIAYAKKQGLSLPVTKEDIQKGIPLSKIVETQLGSKENLSLVESNLVASQNHVNHLFFLELRDVNLNASFHQIMNNEEMGGIIDARAQLPNQYALGIDGRLATGYDGPWLRLGLFGQSQFFRTTQIDQDQQETAQETRDVLLFEGESRFKPQAFFQQHPNWIPSPNLRLSYETEWTPNQQVVDGIETELPRRAELRAGLGFGLSPKPWLNDFRLGFLLEKDFAAADQNGSLEWGAETAWAGLWPVGVFQFQLDGFLRGYAPQPDLDTADDVFVVAQTVARLKIPAFMGLNLSLFADSYVLVGKTQANRGPAVSLILGVTLGYGKRLKWLPLGT